ncbi:MAG: glycerol-3-phosphate acyltransferase [Christensenellales bacterium]
MCAYLLSSLSFAIIVSKVTLMDIRNYGSGNAGLTNAYRTMGAKKTLFVLLETLQRDCRSGFGRLGLGGPVGKLTAGILLSSATCFRCISALGRQGVLVGAVMLAFLTGACSSLHSRCSSVGRVTKWISLGSILGAVSFPITTWLFYRDPVLTAMAFGMAAAVIFMHRSNIGRILHGTENKFSFKSKKTIEASPDGEEK